jgi:hypothetical protein
MSPPPRCHGSPAALWMLAVPSASSYITSIPRCSKQASRRSSHSSQPLSHATSRFTLRIILFTLRCLKDARIQWPVGDEFQENNDLVLARHPLLVGAFGTMDGLNLPVQTSRDQELENATFNGWLQEHFISSVFAFGADGKFKAGCYDS